MTHTTLNFQTATGHQVLAAAGKTALRPGGRTATEQLFEWADFQPGDTVLELASSFGNNAIALAQRYGVRVVGVEKNSDSVARAQANVAAAGLTDQVQIIQGDIFRLDELAEQFDYVLAEAILTMQSPVGKAKVLAGVCDRLKPGGQFLSHELLARDRADEIRQALAQVLKVNSSPLSLADWTAAIAQAGLTIQKSQTGAMKLLDWRQVIRDEGWQNSLRILFNVLTQKPIRDRVLAMRRVFRQYQGDLGHILICAERPTDA